MKKTLIGLGILSLGLCLIFFSPTIVIYAIAGFQIGTWSSDIARKIWERYGKEDK